MTAISVVLIAAVILRATAVGMTHATDWFEIMSYALVAAVGAWLLLGEADRARPSSTAAPCTEAALRAHARCRARSWLP